MQKVALQGTRYEGRNEREGSVGIQQVNENEIRLKWHPFPEEKPKKKGNCIVSVAYFEKEFTTTSWWDPKIGGFEDFPKYIEDIITAWSYMPRPYKKKKL